jgi:hypothetical protein
MRRLTLVALVVLTAPAALRAVEPPRVFVTIVANNGSYDGSRPPLRFADDDGVRYRELFGLYSRDVELYTVMEPDTQQIVADAVGNARLPKRAEVLAGLARTFGKIRAAKEEGARTAFYVL